MLVINKWDLVGGQADATDYRAYLDAVLPGLRHAPLVMTEATAGRNVQAVLDVAIDLYEQASLQIPTGRLNQAVEAIRQERVSVARKHGGLPKIYYATQVGVRPVSLLLFVNDPDRFDAGFQRFIVNRLRDLLDLDEVPIRLLLRRRH